MGKKFEKGNPGRPKGAKNKATLQRADILAMVLGALQDAGGRKAFVEWAKDKRGKQNFLKEVVGLIPKEDTLNVKQVVSFSIVQPPLPKEPEKK